MNGRIGQFVRSFFAVLWLGSIMTPQNIW